MDKPLWYLDGLSTVQCHQALPASTNHDHSTMFEWSNVHPAGNRPHSACLKLLLFHATTQLAAFQR